VCAERLDEQDVREPADHRLRAGLDHGRLRREELEGCFQPLHGWVPVGLHMHHRWQPLQKCVADGSFKGEVTRHNGCGSAAPAVAEETSRSLVMPGHELRQGDGAGSGIIS
jgi:hypothetical protein